MSRRDVSRRNVNRWDMGGRVLLVANNFPPVRGGSAVVYDNVARSAGGRIDVVAPRIGYVDGLPSIGWREHDRRAPYRVLRLRLLRTLLDGAGAWRPARRLRLLASDVLIRLSVSVAMARLVRRGGYRAVCLGELLASGWMITPLQRLLGLRVVVYVHGEELTIHDPFDPRRQRCRRRLQQADGIVVVSRYTRDVVLELLGAGAAGKVALIGNGVAVGRFTPGPKRADLVERYGLGDDFVFVSVCRLLEKKGLDNALRAFQAIAGDQAAACRFLVVGSGPYEASLAALACQLGIRDRVTFAGSVPEEDLVDCYRLGDVFVMPNRELANGDTEGFGLVFLEANGCGLPVVAGRDGGSTEAVKDGVNGLVVDGRSVPAIAAAMRRLRDDPALCRRMRADGLAVAAASDWASKAETLLRFCLDGRGAEAWDAVRLAAEQER